MKSNALVIDVKDFWTEVNPKYRPYLKNKDRYLVLCGSAGSGKSHFAAQKIIHRCITEDVGHRILVIRKTSKTLNDSAFKLIRNYLSKWGLLEHFYVQKKEMRYTFMPNGNEIFCSGLDDPEKLKSIEGITSVWLEEATELELEDFTQIDLRLRPNFEGYAQILLSYNPVDKKNWTYKRFYDPENPKGYRKKTTFEFEYKGERHVHDTHVSYVHSTYKDNDHLPPAYIASINELRNTDPIRYRIYTLGEYADFLTQVYHNWEVVSHFPHDSFDKEYYGLDFGFNHPIAMVWIGENEKSFCVKTLLKKSGLTTKDAIDIVKKMPVFNKRLVIYGDSAEPDRIEEFKRAGLSIKPAYKAKGSVKDGLDYIKTKTIYVLRDDVEMIDELSGYKYKEDKDGVVTEEPLKTEDDLVDAMRYGIYSYYKETGNTPKVRYI